jgi:prepilin-type N-terminal cleavage/methylation domain-containing protein
MIPSQRQYDWIHRPAPQRGFTLIEMVVTVAILSVIMLGMGSAMIIATRALPEAENPAAAAIAAGSAAERLATELQYAVSINDSNATAIEFTVADRDDDDVAETIRYEWSGTPGDPLTRQYNGATAYEVLADVSQFELSYDLKTASVETQSPTESAETSLSSYSVGTDLGDYDVTSTGWYAQYFLPSLPADAISWRVTRVQFRACKSGGSTGESRVQLQSAATGLPSGTVLEEKTFLESTLTSSYTAREFCFSTVTDLSPDEGLCLVFKWIADSTACTIEGQTSGAAPADGYLLTSADGGGSWSLQSGQSLLYAVYGTVTTPGEPQVETTHYLGGANLTLQAGSDNQTTVQTGVRALNEPEVIQ